jgi:amino acid permease
MEKALEKFEHSIKDMPRTYGEASLNNDVAKLKYDKPLNLKTDKNVLPRTLSVYSGAMQNIGCNIGAGIFILQGSMLADVGSCGLVIVYFFIGGLISFFGKCSY